MNITIDDSSPQIKYLGNKGWFAEHFVAVTDYYQQSFTSSDQARDTCIFNFRAPGIVIYVLLDQESPAFYDGYNPVNLFLEPLFSRNGLDPKIEHTITIVNEQDIKANHVGSTTQKIWLDIDYVLLTAPLPSDMKTENVDDTDSRFVYSSGDWVREDSGLNEWFGDTIHKTQEKGAFVDVKFNGISVQVLGSIGLESGNYTVSLDGQDAMMLNGTYFEMRTGVSLFAAAGLTQGEHVVRFTNVDGKTLSVDQAVINSTTTTGFSSSSAIMPSTLSSTASISATLSTSALTSTISTESSSFVSSSLDSGLMTGGEPATDSVSQSNSHSNIGAIVGGILGTIACLGLAFIILFLIRRKHRNKTRHYKDDIITAVQARIDAGISFVPSRDRDTDRLTSIGPRTEWMSDVSSI